MGANPPNHDNTRDALVSVTIQLYSPHYTTASYPIGKHCFWCDRLRSTVEVLFYRHVILSWKHMPRREFTIMIPAWASENRGNCWKAQRHRIYFSVSTTLSVSSSRDEIDRIHRSFCKHTILSIFAFQKQTISCSHNLKLESIEKAKANQPTEQPWSFPSLSFLRFLSHSVPLRPPPSVVLPRRRTTVLSKPRPRPEP